MENIIKGDALSILKTMKEESVNLIVTSPPYYGLRNYQIEPIIFGGNPTCEHEFNLVDKKDPMDRGGNGDHDKEGLHGNKIDYKTYKVGYCSKCQAWLGCLGLEIHPQEYIEHIVQIVSECMRVLRKDGVMFLNVGDSYGSHRDSKSSNKNKCSEAKQDSLMIKNAPNKLLRDNWYRNKQKLLIPHRIAIALQEKGFIIRDDICWIKKLNIMPDRTSIGSTMPFPCKDKLLPATEYIFQIVKSEKYFFNLEDVKTQIKNSTIERAKRPLSSTYTNEINGNPYTKHEGMKNANEKWKNGENKTANPTNAIIFRRMNQHSKGAVQEHFASFPLSLSDYFVSVGCPEFVCNKCGRIKETKNVPVGEFEEVDKEGVVFKNNKPYAVKEREGFVKVRDLPDLKKFSEYINNARRLKGVTIEEVEEFFKNQSPHHWFSGESFPSKEDYLKLKEYLYLNDDFDKELTNELWKPAEKCMTKYKKKIISCDCKDNKFEGGIVLDPFMGSGTTGISALKQGKKFIGIELNENYISIAKKRLVPYLEQEKL